ncbi:AP-5 complex subunit zeta-1 [Mactra antiquata]
MIDAVASGERNNVKECLLCQRVLQELLPLDDEFTSSTVKMLDKIPSVHHLQLFKDVGCVSRLFNTAVRWLQTQDLEFELHRKAFTFLTGVSILHSQILGSGKVKNVNEQLSNWLMNASLYQAPNPYSSNPFRKDQNNMVTEIDGAPSNNFFTVLSIGQYYTDDQLANIMSFSMLYQWIYHSYTSLTSQDIAKLESGLVTDIEESGGFKLSEPRSISGNRQNTGTRSGTPTSKPTSLSVIVGWVSSPKTSTSEKQTLRATSSLPIGRTSPRNGSPSTQSSRETTPAGSLSSLSSMGPTSDLSEQKSLSGSIRSLQESSRVTTPSKSARSVTPSMILGPAMSLDEKDNLDQSVIKRVFDNLVGRTIDYCFRILDQCDRKPKVPLDIELQNACILEAVKLLDLICNIDSGQVPKTFRELKRLVAMTTQDDNNPRLLIAVLQFLLNHSEAVAYDPSEELKVLFHRVLSHNINTISVCFDIVLFILDNIETLTYDHKVMATYFPNMLKLLAWHPRTFVSDFVEFIPAMMSSVTSLEVFHALIDLPCMSVSLDIIERTKTLDFTSAPVMTDMEPTKAMDAFRNAMFRPMFNFFTRAEGGHGDTINRLSQFHAALQDMMEHPRVLVCYQTVPVLLRCWFNVILEECDEKFAEQLLPVLIERTGVLYGIPEYQSDIKRIISDNAVLLLKKFPQIVYTLRNDIVEYLSNTRNIIDREQFYCQLVWAVGDFTSATYSTECSADTVSHMYEMLEVVTYEVISVTGSMPASQSPYSIKLVSVLMSAMAKLSSRCQDLIPRAILCLTKVAKQHKTDDILDSEDQEILLSRAQELINILKLPNFASVILNPSRNIETNRCHRDRSSMSTVLRTTHRMVAPTL